MSVQRYTGARMYVDGKEVPLTSLSIDCPPIDEAEAASELKPCDFSGSMTFVLEGHGMSTLLELYMPKNIGASDMTLAKRMSYGGRKGKAAWRRLRAKGFVGTLVINDEAPIPCPPLRISYA